MQFTRRSDENYFLNKHTLCQQYLTELYLNMRGHGINERQHQNIPETYGEILYESIVHLLSQMTLSEQDSFLDLGSGLGKVVIQVFLQSAVKESRGIEIIPELYDQSIIASQKIKEALPVFFEKERKLTFQLGSFLEIPLHGASILLIGSVLFSPAMLCALGKIIDSTDSIHTVLTLRPILTLKRLTFKKVIRVECSWDTALCYLYQDFLKV